MSPQPVALGLVGCGRLAEVGYVPALATAAGARLVAVADPDPARRDLISGLAGRAGPDGRGTGPVAAFPGAAELLDAGEVDGLILATPAAAHLADAALAGAAGVAVLVEKPPAPDVAGAAELAAANPRLWVGFNRRFDPGARAVRDLVPADGHVELRLEIGYRRRGWGAHAVRDDALLDLGPHLVDWARWLSSSEAVGVACREVGTERAALEVTLARGRARLRAATDRPHAELVEVRDGSGDLVARHRLGGLLAAVRGRLPRLPGAGPPGGAGRAPGPDALVTSLAAQVEAFAAAVRGGSPAGLASAADGLAAMTVLDAARASAASGGRTVPLPRPVET